MERETIREIYIEACRTKRRAPERGEMALWLKQFELVEASDLRAALNAWWADSTPTGNGQPRGSFFPQPVELKPLVNLEYARRVSRASGKKLLARWQCESCGVTCAGFIEPSDHRPRYCRGVPRDRGYQPGSVCGTLMTEIFREAYQEEEPVRFGPMAERGKSAAGGEYDVA